MKTEQLSPAKIRELRARLAHEVGNLIPTLVGIAEGKIKATPAQVRAIALMMSRVIPEVSQNLSEVRHVHDVSKLSRDDLEAIARGEVIDLAAEPQAALTKGEADLEKPQ